MTASGTKFASGDKPMSKNSTAESRRASKPLMEKRRRARINQSLAILKSLIVDSQRVEGQKHAKHKIEKADILEMVVSHLQSVKKSDEEKFKEGFEECFSETTRFLEKSKLSSSIIDKLADHMKQFQQNLNMSASIEMSQQLGGELKTVSKSNSATSAAVEENPVTLTVESKDSSGSLSPTFSSLNITRLPKAKKASSSIGHPSCLSPAFSNDSNNNNFLPEVDFRHRVASPSQAQFLAGVAEAVKLDPIENPSAENYVLNLSTHTSINSSLNYLNRSPPMLDSRLDIVEPMDECLQPLDLPLNLCKHPLGYRLSEDGVWRPW